MIMLDNMLADPDQFMHGTSRGVGVQSASARCTHTI